MGKLLTDRVSPALKAAQEENKTSKKNKFNNFKEHLTEFAGN